LVRFVLVFFLTPVLLFVGDDGDGDEEEGDDNDDVLVESLEIEGLVPGVDDDDVLLGALKIGGIVADVLVGALEIEGIVADAEEDDVLVGALEIEGIVDDAEEDGDEKNAVAFVLVEMVDLAVDVANFGATVFCPLLASLKTRITNCAPSCSNLFLLLVYRMKRSIRSR